MGLINIESVRSIQWDKSNLWDVTIDGIKNPNGWFPANDLELGFHGLTEGTYGALSYAQGTTFPLLTMSYMDDEKLSVTLALKSWMSEIVSSNSLIVQPPEKAKKAIIIKKLNSMRSVIKEFTIYAHPTGQITYHGDSDGSTPIYSLQFTIIGSDLHG